MHVFVSLIQETQKDREREREAYGMIKDLQPDQIRRKMRMLLEWCVLRFFLSSSALYRERESARVYDNYADEWFTCSICQQAFIAWINSQSCLCEIFALLSRLEWYTVSQYRCWLVGWFVSWLLYWKIRVIGIAYREIKQKINKHKKNHNVQCERRVRAPLTVKHMKCMCRSTVRAKTHIQLESSCSHRPILIWIKQIYKYINIYRNDYSVYGYACASRLSSLQCDVLSFSIGLPTLAYYEFIENSCK